MSPETYLYTNSDTIDVKETYLSHFLMKTFSLRYGGNNNRPNLCLHMYF